MEASGQFHSPAVYSHEKRPLTGNKRVGNRKRRKTSLNASEEPNSVAAVGNQTTIPRSSSPWPSLYAHWAALAPHDHKILKQNLKSLTSSTCSAW